MKSNHYKLEIIDAFNYKEFELGVNDEILDTKPQYSTNDGKNYLTIFILRFIGEN